MQVSLRNALAQAALAGEVRRFAAESPTARLRSRISPPASPRMQTALKLAEKAAASDIPVLIEGESGVGKELIARAIRSAGNRATKPFVAVNCGAIPANLVESILFGHEKGAFTGAHERSAGKIRRGRWRHAVPRRDRRASRDAQVKLLRAIAGWRDRSRGRAQAGEDRLPPHLRDEPRPPAARPRGQLPRGPVLPSAHLPNHGPTACAIASRTCRSSSAVSLPVSPPRKESACARCPPKRCGLSPHTAGLATCGNWRTPSSARWSLPRRTRSASPSFRRSRLRFRDLRVTRCPPLRLHSSRRNQSVVAARRRRIRRRRCPGRGTMRWATSSHLRARTAMFARWRHLEAEAIRFAIDRYRGRMTEVARRLQNRPLDPLPQAEGSGPRCRYRGREARKRRGAVRRHGRRTTGN